MSDQVSNNNSDDCVDPDIGGMLAAYESGLLPPDDQSRFESHVGSCPFCRKRLHQMSPFVTAVQTETGSMSPGATSLPNQKSFERSMLKGTFGTQDPGTGSRFPAPAVIWKTYAPLTVIVLITLALLVTMGQKPSPSTYARFEQPDAGFIESIPPETIGRAELIQGLELFVADQTDAAIEALRSSVASPHREVRGCARWFLAQAYLMRSDREKAEMHLQKLTESKSRYRQTAADQLRELSR